MAAKHKAFTDSPADLPLLSPATMHQQRSLSGQLLLLLLAVVLSCQTDSISAARANDGAIRAQLVTGMASHPTTGSLYFIDAGQWIRILDKTGRPQPPVATIGVYPSRLDAIALDPPNDLVYALLSPRFVASNYTLVTLTGDLRNVSSTAVNGLLNPPLRPYDYLQPTVLVDSAGTLYLFHQLPANNSMVCHVLSGGEQIDHWYVPIVLGQYSDNEFAIVMAPGDIIMMLESSYYDDEPKPLYVMTTGGVLISNASLGIGGLASPGAIAVSPLTGMLAVSFWDGLYLFDSNGTQLPWAYESPLDDWNVIDYVTFDTNGRLLAVDILQQVGVQVISLDTGNLITCWINGPAELQVGQLIYQPQTKSLLVSSNGPGIPTLRLDAEDGRVVQQFSLSGRYEQCLSFASAIGASGDIYRLLECDVYDPSDSPIVFHAVNQAGQLRREVHLIEWTINTVQFDLLVCEEKGLFYLMSTNWTNASNNRIMAFSFNGSSVWTATDSRIGIVANFNTRLIRVGDNQLALLNSYYDRIILLDLATGAYLGDVPVSKSIQLMSAVYGGKYWYRSEYVSGGPYYDLRIGQYAEDGSLVQTFTADSPGDWYWLNGALTIDEGGQRLYALQNSYAKGFNGRLVWWDLKADEDERRNVTADEVVRVVQPSGAHAVRDVDGDALTQKERALLLHASERSKSARLTRRARPNDEAWRRERDMLLRPHEKRDKS